MLDDAVIRKGYPSMPAENHFVLYILKAVAPQTKGEYEYCIACNELTDLYRNHSVKRAGSSVAIDRKTPCSCQRNTASEATMSTKDHSATPSGIQLASNCTILCISDVVAPTPAAPPKQPQQPKALTKPKHHSSWMRGKNSPCSPPDTKTGTGR